MIEADIARAQLRQRLDVRERTANGRARLDGAARLDGDAAAAPMADDPVMASIKSARLRQIELANAKAEAEAVERAGRFVSAADAKQEMGVIAGRMVSAFEGALTELAERSPTPGRCIGTPCSPYAERGGPSGHAWQARPRPQGTRNLPRPSLGRRCRSSRPRLAGHRFGLQIRAARGLSGLGEGQRRFRGRRAGAWPIQSGRLPSFPEILKALGPDDPCRYVTFAGSAQIGKTVLANIFALGSVTMGRGTTLVCHPTTDNALRWSKMKLAPMMRSIEAVQHHFPRRSRDTSDSLLFKARADGLANLLITGANSPASLSQITVNFRVQDDLSKWDMNSAGAPETMADNRSRAVEFAKILKTSTPLVLPGCRITKDFEAGSQEMPFVPCPTASTCRC